MKATGDFREARSLARRLAAKAALRRLRGRVLSWGAGCLAVWGALSLAAVLTELPATAYYGIMMTALGSLFPVLAWPPRGEPFLSLVRSLDEYGVAEACLGAREGPALPLLLEPALVRLRVAEAEGEGGPAPLRQRLGPPGRWAALLSGLALLAAAQALSVRAGYGFSWGYPDKSALARAERRTDDYTRSPDLRERLALAEESPEGREGENAQAIRPRPGADQYGGAGGNTPLARRSRSPGANDPGASGQELPSGGERESDTSPGDGTHGAPGSGEEDENADARNQLQGSERRSGYEGSGQALMPSPLLEYRAIFERQFAERTGRESALGADSSPAAAQRSIEQLFASYARDIVLKPVSDARFEALRAAWLAALGER